MSPENGDHEGDEVVGEPAASKSASQCNGGGDGGGNEKNSTTSLLGARVVQLNFIELRLTQVWEGNRPEF